MLWQAFVHEYFILAFVHVCVCHSLTDSAFMVYLEGVPRYYCQVVSLFPIADIVYCGIDSTPDL